MDKVTQTFRFLADIMNNAFHIECAMFSDLSMANTVEIDHGLRKMMWNDYDDAGNRPSWLATYLTEPSFLIIRSNLGFYNILITIMDSDMYYLTIGPFRSEAANAVYFERIIRESGITREKMSEAQSLFRALPIASLSAVTASAKRIVEEFYPEFAVVEAAEKKFTDEIHTPNLSNDDNQYISHYSESYKALLTNYLNSLRKGNLSESRANLKAYLDHSLFDSANSPDQLQRTAIMLNDYSALALFTTDIHPRRILELQSQMMKSIITAGGRNALAYIPYDICHKYNLLVKNHNYSEYSKIIRDVVNYVDMNLEEDLSLEAVASRFNRNSSTLSSQFHRETGQTFTAYIRQARVKAAITLLNSTNKNISEISVEVGYDDFAYFSRVFKQLTGLSPRAYKQRYEQ